MLYIYTRTKDNIPVGIMIQNITFFLPYITFFDHCLDKEVMLHGQGYKKKLQIVAGVLGVLFLLGCIPLGYQLSKEFLKF